MAFNIPSRLSRLVLVALIRHHLLKYQVLVLGDNAVDEVRDIVQVWASLEDVKEKFGVLLLSKVGKAADELAVKRAADVAHEVLTFCAVETL